MYIITWKKCNKRRTWKGKESLSHEYKRSEKTYHSYFLKYLRNLLETIAKLGTLSFIICFCKITSCFCHIIYSIPIFKKYVLLLVYLYIYRRTPCLKVYNTFLQDEQHERNWWKYKSQVSGLWCKFFSSLRAHKRIPMFVITLFITLTWYQS